MQKPLTRVTSGATWSRLLLLVLFVLGCLAAPMTGLAQGTTPVVVSTVFTGDAIVGGVTVTITPGQSYRIVNQGGSRVRVCENVWQPRGGEAVAVEAFSFKDYQATDSVTQLVLASGSDNPVTVYLLRQSMVTLSQVAADGLYSPMGRGWHPGRNGLARWQSGLGQILKTAGGRGMGGVDVLFVGDSIFECNIPGSGVGQAYTSGGLTDYLQSKTSHYLKVALQKALNPPGVQGGYGYIPRFSHATPYPGSPAPGIITQFGSDQGVNPGVAAKSVVYGSGSNGAFISLNPTNVPADYRYNVTDLDIVAARGPVVGTFRYDVKAGGTGGAAMIGTGEVTGSINGNGALQFGSHWKVSGINRAVANTFQVAGPATGTGVFYFDGLILYDNDYDCGVRVHNLASWGQPVSIVSSAATGGDGLSLGATITQFCNGTPGQVGGAIQGKLVLFDWITNDVGATDTPFTPVSTFIARYASQVDAALTAPSKPSVILVIPPLRGGITATVRANYDTYRKAIYAMAATRPDVSILDLWEYAGFEAYSGFVTANGWNADMVHYSDIAQRAWAQILFRILTTGYSS